MRFTCHDIRERWPEYIYRELSEPEQSLFVRHLDECPACRNEEQEWRGMLEQFDSIASLDGSMDAPPELVYRVKRQVSLYEDWSKQFSTRVRRWTIGAAAACILIAGGICGTLPGVLLSKTQSAQVSAPLQKSVMQSIYPSETLRFYSEQGILEKEKAVTSDELIVTSNDLPFPFPLGEGS